MDKSLDPFALTRRQILPAAGFALSGLFMPPLVQAQTAAPLRVLEAKKGRLNLTGKAGEDFEIWGFDGQSPGPILRVCSIVLSKPWRCIGAGCAIKMRWMVWRD